MAQSFLIFDFGTDEEAAQEARHRIDRWKQAFRLDKKLLLKFDREEREEKKGNGTEGQRIRVIVRLDFSDHEKLSQQRWLDRIDDRHELPAHRHAQPAAGDLQGDRRASPLTAQAPMR